MTIRSFDKKADPSIPEDVLRECRSMIGGMNERGLPEFDEMVRDKHWGSLQATMRGWIGLAKEHPDRYPTVTKTQLAAAERLLGQLQFTGQYR